MFSTFPRQINTKQKIILVALFSVFVFLIVLIFYFVTLEKRYPPTPPGNPSAAETQLKEIQKALDSKLVLSENAGGGKSPRLFHSSSSLLPNTLTLFYLSPSSSLNILSVSAEGEKLSDPGRYSADGVIIKSFDITQNGDEGFLFSHRLKEEQQQLVLEKFNKDLLPVQSSVLFSAPVSESFFGPSRESFDDAVIVFSDDSLYVFTKTILSDTGAMFHVRIFDANLKFTGFEKDIPVQKTKVTAGNLFAPVIAGDKNYIIVTTQRHGTSLCPQPDKTTQTELAALVYDKDWNPLDENVVLTDHKRVTHHPIDARFYNGKILILYFVNDADRDLPQCINDDIPKEGILKLDIYNTNLKRLQSLDVHDGTGGLAQLSSLLPVNESLYVSYSLQRQEIVNAPTALMLSSYNLSEREAKTK